MYLENLYENMGNAEGNGLTKFARESSTFTFAYQFWFEHLFERTIKLFEMKGTYDVKTNKGIKPKEITTRLYTQGHCGITKIPKEYLTKEDKFGELSALFGNYFGISKYFDDKPYYMCRCPIWTGEREIDKDIVVIDNTSLKNPITPLIHHYAVMLGHTDVTLVDLCITARDSGGIPVVGNERQKQSVTAYLAKLFNGQFGVVTDKGSLGINYVGGSRTTSQSIMEVMETREKLIKSFYSAIGVRSAFEKRNNSVVAEVESDTSLLQINLNDMLECRKIGFEKVNKMFDTNWSVSLAKEIDYGAENERIKFAMFDDIHTADVSEREVENGNSTTDV